MLWVCVSEGSRIWVTVEGGDLPQRGLPIARDMKHDCYCATVSTFTVTNPAYRTYVDQQGPVSYLYKGVWEFRKARGKKGGEGCWGSNIPLTGFFPPHSIKQCPAVLYKTYIIQPLWAVNSPGKCVVGNTWLKKKGKGTWKRQMRWYGVSEIWRRAHERETLLELPRENRKWRQKRQEVPTGCCVIALCYRWKNTVTKWNKGGGKKNYDTVKMPCDLSSMKREKLLSGVDHKKHFFFYFFFMWGALTQQVYIYKPHTHTHTRDIHRVHYKLLDM